MLVGTGPTSRPSSAPPVAAGLYAGPGLFARAGSIAGPRLVELTLGVGWPDGVICAGVVLDVDGVPVGVPDGVPLGDGLPDGEVLPVGDGLPEGDGLLETDVVGGQLGVDGLVDLRWPPLLWLAGAVPPPLPVVLV